MSICGKMVRGSLSKLVDESRRHTFRSEGEVQGYFVATLQDALSSLPLYKCQWGLRTDKPYVRNSTSHLEEGMNGDGRKGYVDVAILSDDRKIVGIEMEYPRGIGLAAISSFDMHIRNDLKKLNDLELDEKYFVMIVYNDPQIDDLPAHLEDLLAGNEDIKFIYMRFNSSAERRKKNSPIFNIQRPAKWFSVNKA